MEPSSHQATNDNFKAIAFDSTVAAEPPIPITIATSPSVSIRPGTNGQTSPRTESGSLSMKSRSQFSPPATAHSSATVNESHATSPVKEAESVRSFTGVPRIHLEQDATPPKKGEKWKYKKSMEKEPVAETSPFQPITMDIPTGGLDDFNADSLQFSKRGSVMWAGQKKNGGMGKPENGHLQAMQNTRRIKSNPSLRVKASQQKSLSVDEEVLSQKVRSFYEVGTDAPVEGDDRSSISQNNVTIWEDSTVAPEGTSATSISRNTSHTDVRSVSSFRTNDTRQRFAFQREELELAGGYEDWRDVKNEDVDRYGFIITRSPSLPTTNQGIQRSPSNMEGHTLQRVSTSLQLASETPRRKHTIRRQPSKAQSTRSLPGSPPNKQSIKSGRPSSSSQSLYGAPLTHSHSRIRAATNKLPHNKDRRLLDEAADMLTIPPRLADKLVDGGVGPSETPQMKRKEWAREEKWKKMAKVVSKGPKGGGMTFEFDVQNPKVVERTWKGIPDRWRSTAWHCFLTASAKKQKKSLSEEELTQMYHEYQEQSSPEDVQIDIDVPRTVGSHIMFRRRYRGGQRLLFRVLHAMSLHFPETGYVQGMATLAATLLAYYDEERAFVMLVRLWELRGLEQLYKHGFAGLMEALDDFEKGWLKNGEVAVKLNELGIGPTAYGTRWYLTLFNYSIPFSAQLRVWDVFMLLGDSSSDPITLPVNGNATSTFGSTLDVLHAASAALIAGTKDILLESDFENAMKVLTSWIPIRDDDMFMRVAKSEYKVHKRKGAQV